MATSSKPDVDLTETWQDITGIVSGIASVAVRLQCVRGTAAIVHGGSQPNGDRSGEILRLLDTTEPNAAAIWCKGVGGPARLSVTAL